MNMEAGFCAGLLSCPDPDGECSVSGVEAAAVVVQRIDEGCKAGYLATHCTSILEEL